ncbi:MAG: hypothetical protein ACLPSF_04970, partial [Methylocella sp.]
MAGVFVVVTALVTGPSAIAQTARAAISQAPRSGAPIPGYLDVNTGIFYPLGLSDQSSPVPSAALVTRTGTWSVVATVNIDPSIPASATLTASFSATVADPVSNSGAYYNYTATGGGTLTRKGNVATITLSVPYVWNLANSADTVSLYLGVSANTADSPSLGFSQTVPLPASGQTTKVT